jgi:hypothetical protein
MRNSTLIDEERSVALLKGIWTLFACKLSEPQKQATHRKDVDLLWITCRRDNVPVVLGNVILYGHNIYPYNVSDEYAVRFVISHVKHDWQVVADLYFMKAPTGVVMVEPWHWQGDYVLSDGTPSGIAKVQGAVQPAMDWLQKQITKLLSLSRFSKMVSL